MTPDRRPWPALTAVALLALLPTAVLLAVSYRGALRSAQADTDDTARRGQRRVEELFAAADAKLRGYARDVARHPADARQEWLGRVVYNDSRFREAGETDALGRLTLTDRGPVTPPVPVPPGERADPANPATQLLGRFATAVMKEESIVLTRPIPGGPGELRSVDLLVQPEVLTEPFAAADLGPTGYLAFVRAADGQLLAGVGAVPPAGLLAPAPAGRLRGEATAAGGSVKVVAEVSTQWAARHWAGEFAFGVPLTLLTTLGLLRLAYGLAERRRGLDAELAPALRQRPNFYLTVNLPPAMLTSGRASRALDAAPVGSPLTPDRLVFELTERQLLDGPADEVAGEMLALRERGVRFGLDDFGTGYSSLSYLHKFRFDILKLDKSFLPGPDRSDAGAAVLKSLIDLGTRLSLTLIAEGVERPEQAECLRGHAVSYAQGWLYCRALPIADFLDRLKLEG